MDNIIDKLTNIKCNDMELFTLNNIKTIGKVVDVYDGDTCKIILLYNNELHKFVCRLTGIDTPEMKPPLKNTNRDQEILSAYKCRNRLVQLVSNCDCPIENTFGKKEFNTLIDTNTKIINITCHEFDKYGRLLVSLYDINDIEFTQSFNKILIDEKYAKSYSGGTKEKFDSNI